MRHGLSCSTPHLLVSNRLHVLSSCGVHVAASVITHLRRPPHLKSGESFRQSSFNMASPLRSANLQTLRSCRLCIICAKSTEAINIKDTLNLRTKISGRDVADLPPGARGHDFWLGNFSLKGKCNLSYYITSMSRQGIQSCATETASLFTILRPTYALLVGTCAAIKGQGYKCVTNLSFGSQH